MARRRYSRRRAPRRQKASREAIRKIASLRKELQPPLRSIVDNNFQKELLSYGDTAELLRAPGTTTAAPEQYREGRTIRLPQTDGTSLLAGNINKGGGVYLEVARPLIYEPIVLQRLCGEDRSPVWTQGQGREARVCKNVRLSGSFRITMIAGTNSPAYWQDNKTNVVYATPNSSGVIETSYGDLTYAEPQYVRVLGLVVNDMGDGFGPQLDALQNSDNSNFTNQSREDGTNDTWLHYLAPAPSDIFDLYSRDPNMAMGETATDIWPDAPSNVFTEDRINVLNSNINGHKMSKLYDNKLLTYKYKRNQSGAMVVPETALGITDSRDPLRRERRDRNFHVFYDKKIMFHPSGQTTESFNGTPGQQEADIKWNLKLPMIRCNRPTNSPSAPDYVETRKVNGTNKRVFFYFMPSIARTIAGQPIKEWVVAPPSQTIFLEGNMGSGHHSFLVKRGPEKCSWRE